MKKSLALGICLLLSCSGAQASQEQNLSAHTKAALGVVVTAGFAYALWRLSQDVNNQPKRYNTTTPTYIRDNCGQFTSDAFTSVGLAYLTYQSGLYTLEAIKELTESEEKSEDPEED